MPAEATLFGFIEDAGVLFKLFEDLGALAAELVRLVFESCDERPDGVETLGTEVPLRRGQALDELLIPCPSSMRSDMEFSSAEKKSMRGRTP